MRRAENLFKLVSLSHIHYFYRVPRIPAPQLEKYRRFNYRVCRDKGEVFEGMMQKSPDEVKTLPHFTTI
ncbi:hypothetical protein ACEQPO_13355 [Bacillus sp. SL00103]